MIGSIAYKNSFEDYEKQEYREFICGLSTKSAFDDDIWMLDKLRISNAQKANDYSIYYINAPAPYKETIKYYAALKLMNGIRAATCRSIVRSLCQLGRYAIANDIADLSFCCRYAFAEGFKKYLDNRLKSENTKSNLWGAVKTFYRSMYAENIGSEKDAFENNPYRYQRKIEDKFIPDEIIGQLDAIFSDEKILLYRRLIYWVLRLIPSRISEVCAISIDCLKQWGGRYILFIPTWKQNGGHFTGEIRSIHLEYTSMGKYLIDLIKEQQAVSKGLQEYLAPEHQGLLFTHLLTWENAKGTTARLTQKKGMFSLYPLPGQDIFSVKYAPNIT